MGHLHALGPTRRAGGEDDVGEIGRLCGAREGAKVGKIVAGILVFVDEKHGGRFEPALGARGVDALVDGAGQARR